MAYFDPVSSTYKSTFDAGSVTIASGVATLPVIPTGAEMILVSVDTESAASSDTLDSFSTTGYVAVGTKMIVRQVANARNVVVNSALSSAIILSGGSDITLDTTDDFVELVKNNAGGWSGSLATVTPSVLFSNPLYARVDSATALANDTTEQPMFASASDALTVEAGQVYKFFCLGSLTTGATSASVTFSLNGTATFTTSQALGAGIHAASGTAGTLVLNNNVDINTGFVVVAAGTGVNKRFMVWGEFEVNAGGTIIPSVTFSADPTGTCTVQVGSFFEAYKMGTNPLTYIGAWA